MQDAIIDGMNITSKCPSVGYYVRYDIRDGGQGGLMLDGSQTEDELAQKSVVVFPLMPMAEADLKTFLELVMPTPAHSVSYYDPWKGYRTMTGIRSIADVNYAGVGADGNPYWKTKAITFTEK